jgi:chromatin remodeling complex protein RSC6
MPAAPKKQTVAPANDAKTKVPEEPVKELVKEVLKEPVVQPAKAAEPVAAKKPRVTKATTAAAKTEATEPAVPVAATSTEEGAETPSATENAVQVLADKIGALAALLKDIQSSLKPVLKEHDKLRKVVERIQKKRENARKSPSGFAKPNKISDELCDFIGVPHGTEKSRTDITRYINAYVKEHNLNKPTNRRVILPDEKLKKILKINNEEEVTFFILQRLISHHFPSLSAKNAAAAAAAVAAT